jgi:hypothetical protein
MGAMSSCWYLRLTMRWRLLPNWLAYNFRLPTLLFAPEIPGATFSGAFRGFVVPLPIAVLQTFPTELYDVIHGLLSANCGHNSVLF